MIEWEQIVRIIEGRRASRSPLVDMMVQIRDRYQADYVIPDPSGMTDDVTPILTPALIAEAIDQPALRAASVIPNVFVPALNPTKIRGMKSLEFASKRRGATLASWHDSRLPLLLRRAYRQLRAYDTTCFIVEADANLHMPMIRLRDPLTAFPEPKMPEDLSLPCNAGFVYGKSGDWVREMYPKSRSEQGGPIPESGSESGDDVWDVLEWIDEEVFVIGLLGPRYNSLQRSRGPQPISSDMELDRFVNRAGCCPVVCPQTVTLDQVSSQIAKIIGHVDLQAQLLALEVAAAQKSIFPDRYIIGKGTNAPQIVGGKWNEGSTGTPNILLDVDSIGELRGEPGQEVSRLQDKVERNARVSSGLIPQMGGESGGNVPRTGRGLDTLGSWAVDPRVQELQELMQYALEAVNKAVLKTYVGYWPSRSYFSFYGMGGSGVFAEFQPSAHLAEDQNTKVSYAIAGADKQATTVQLGQQIGAKLISHHTARMKHPDIDDGEEEGRRILEEEVDEALKVGFLQKTAAGGPDGIAIIDAAKVRKYIREGLELDEAMLKVDEERQKAQAAEAQGAPIPPGGEIPAEVAGAGAMPGLGGPTEGVGTGMLPPGIPAAGGIEGPPDPLQKLNSLVGALGAHPGGA